MATNLSIRVPWHDSAWNGTVCCKPKANCHCTDYENILREKDLEWELTRAGERFSDLQHLPPCADESGGFLSPNAWTSRHTHPYQANKKVQATHGHLREVAWTVQAYTAQAVPFHWLGRDQIDSWVAPRIPGVLPPDMSLPEGFKSSWVFSPALQESILEAFFAPVIEGSSLAFFYTKGAHPIGDDIPRLVVGIGTIEKVGPQRYYESIDSSKKLHPVWQRDIRHALRPAGKGGFLVPFHAYLESTGDSEEDLRRRGLARELALQPDPDRLVEFSYRSEHVTQDAAIGLLSRAIQVAGLLRSHGIAEGSWERCETWLNDQLARAWQFRGPHPGVGAVLEAMGLRMATSLVHCLAGHDRSFAKAPWETLSPVLRGDSDPPHERFAADLNAFRALWRHYETDEVKLGLARQMSMLQLEPEQAKRFWDSARRRAAIGFELSDERLTENPYLLAELDRGAGLESRPISFSTVDLGMMNREQGSKCSPADRRRLRAALVAVLRSSIAEGDTLLGVDEARERAVTLPVPEPVNIPEAWIDAEAAFLDERIYVWATEPRALQHQERRSVADRLNRRLRARALKSLPRLDEDWVGLLRRTVLDAVGEPLAQSLDDPRKAEALREQASALEVITGRKATVLVGRAGFGKTTVLGALSRAASQRGKALFLAPTGKARVRLESRVGVGTEVMTVAQFLHSLGRYDGKRQEPLLGDPCYGGHETVVVDEASMLTEDTLAAVVSALDTPVKRLILVGDPGQLPPIGPGRPFADLVAYLDPLEVNDDEDLDELERRRGAIARLRHEVRTVAGGASDALRLARWFTGDALEADAESIFAELADPTAQLADLDVRFWSDSDDLQGALIGAFRDHLKIEDEESLAQFNRSLLMEPYKDGWVPNNPAGAEEWQVLSPVRRDAWGCNELNKWIQRTWRGKALTWARKVRSASGPQEIIKHDKVILLRNGEREGYDSSSSTKRSRYLANGEVGIVRTETSHWKNILFAGRPASETFGFRNWEFGDAEGGGAIVELAYALTVHKAQGSEFGIVFVVLPRTRMAYRELVYTALTRSRRKLVLLLQGDGVANLIELSKPSSSETIRRNTNLFRHSVRDATSQPFARHLVHRAPDGELLRSKSELLIYTRCLSAGLRPRYELRLEPKLGDWKWPDFTFIDDAGDPILWEHLGMTDVSSYVEDWNRKCQWYERYGFVLGRNLFTTEEKGGLDVRKVDAVIETLLKISRA